MSHWDQDRKYATAKRWEREGRGREAKEFVETARVRAIKDGMDSKKAMEFGWDEGERAFGPITEAEILEITLRKAEQKAAAKEEAASPAAAVVRSAILRTGPIPESWGPIPESARQRDEVEWVRQNRFLCLRRLPSGDRLDLSKALRPAPSHYALTVLEWSVGNETAFVKELVPKVLASSEDEDDVELVKAEKKSIHELQGILDKMGEE